MFEDLQYAIKGFKHNKIRTFLSLLGVIIGVTSVIIITTIGQSATANIKSSFSSLGLDLVQVSAGWARRGSGGKQIVLNEEFRQDVFDHIEHIDKIYYVNSVNGTLRYGDTDSSCSINAVETGYLEANSYELAKGEFFNTTDDVEGLQKIVLGAEVAEVLFPEGNALDQLVTLDMNGILFGFRVKGILAAKETMFGPNRSMAFVPRGFYSKKVLPNPNANQMVIKAVSESNASQVAADMESYAAEITGRDHAVSVMSMTTMIENNEATMSTISLLLSGIAAISLLVGGIGIMNIMIVTVTERKKEIGIRKALGASPSDIKLQFLVESATISLTGGFIGIVLGIIISIIIVVILKWTFALNIPVCIASFVFSAAVGIFFGLNPASRAAKLDPVEALAAD